MSNKYEIWLIIILTLIIVITHSLPILNCHWDNSSFEIIEQVTPWFEKIEDDKKTKIGKKIGKKYHVDNLLLKLEDIKNITDFKKTNTIRCGSGVNIFKSKQFSKKINECLDITNDNLIYFVEAKPGHKIDKGKMQFMHNFNNKLKEIKYIWYIFPDLKLDFKNSWVFRNIDDDTYHIPENDSIIEFNKDDYYEMLELKSKESKYFVIILNF